MIRWAVPKQGTHEISFPMEERCRAIHQALRTHVGDKLISLTASLGAAMAHRVPGANPVPWGLVPTNTWHSLLEHVWVRGPRRNAVRLQLGSEASANHVHCVVSDHDNAAAKHAVACCSRPKDECEPGPDLGLDFRRDSSSGKEKAAVLWSTTWSIDSSCPTCALCPWPYMQHQQACKRCRPSAGYCARRQTWDSIIWHPLMRRGSSRRQAIAVQRRGDSWQPWSEPWGQHAAAVRGMGSHRVFVTSSLGHRNDKSP